MLAFKRSSLAASEEQDNVLSRSSRVPHPKVNRLPSPCRLRAHAPPLYDQSAARVKRSEGRAGCCREAERADRVAAKARNHYHARPRGEQTCFSFTLSSVEISCRSVFLSSLFFRRSPLYARRSKHACDIAPKRTAVLSSLVKLSSLISIVSQQSTGRLTWLFSREIPTLVIRRATRCLMVDPLLHMCYIFTSDVNQLVQPPAEQLREHWTRQSRVRAPEFSLFLEESRKFNVYSAFEPITAVRKDSFLFLWFSAGDSLDAKVIFLFSVSSSSS